MDYRYSLKKGGKKLTCPSCGRKGEFVPYIDNVTKEIVNAEKYGRCERVNSCGYNERPKSKEKPDIWKPIQKKVVIEKPIEFIQKSVVEATFSDFRDNVFFMYLVKTFGLETAFELQAKYNIGTAKHCGTIFWQQDNNGKFRTGKVMYYHANGKRDKNRMSWFVHSKIRPDFNYRQCLFGLHLVDGTKPVALCESEKTAILMSVYQPEFTWISGGGSEMLNAHRIDELQKLKRLDKVFADNGQFEKWEQRTKMFNRQMDVSVDKAVANGILPAGSDILDLIQLNL